jgi:hypothetical protein
MHMSLIKNAVKSLVLVGTVSALSVWAQPTPAPTTGDAPCADEPSSASTDTVVSTVDADGYYSLFDGTFKGWFHSCKTSHSNGSNSGAIFRIGQADAKPAIYSTQRGSNTGGLLMTKKKFVNYEIVMDIWPDFGNDGGIFNRTPANGRCFQTVLDYLGGAAMGGTWGEGGFPSRDYRPWAFGGDEKSISIPGLGGGEISNWTTITSKLNPTSFGCPATGCTQADWNTLWDMDGWNQFKIQFYGGHSSTSGAVHMKAWFKKPSSTAWVPTIQDTTFKAELVPAGYIGIQVHGGGRFGGTKGTWYRNIKWRPLDDNGVPVPQVPTTGIGALQKPKYDMKLVANSITGNIDVDYAITVQDVSGRTLQNFHGNAGPFNHALKTNVDGWVNVQIKSSHGSESFRIHRSAK